MALENGFLIADVSHTRVFPKRHSLTYRVYYLCFALHQMRALAGRFLSLTRFNLLGFYEKDHAFSSASLESWMRTTLAQWKLAEADGDIVLLTMPRVLGYVFNPVSFWFCLDREGNLRAVLSEVRNTFGERHCYICFHDDHRVIAENDWLHAQKIFHVSPFLDVRGSYQFRFVYRSEKIGVWIDYYDGDQKMLLTSLVGKRYPLNDQTVLRCFFLYPLLTLKVVMLIHTNALQLLLKKIRYRSKPLPPTTEISR